MPRPRINWIAEIAAWIEAKKANPVLTKTDFYKSRGYNRVSAERKIGNVLTTSWLSVQEEAKRNFEKRAAIDLAKELYNTFNAHKVQFAIGAKNIVSNERIHQPGDFNESMSMMTQGSKGMIEITKVLTGGEAVVPPEPVEAIFRWHEPLQKRKQKIRKPKDKK